MSAATPPSGAPLWQGRMTSAGDDALRALNDSFRFDQRLYAEDIAGSRAHVAMLAQVGLLSSDEAADIAAALETVEREFATGTFVPADTDEDVHTAVERRATELCSAAAKIHTGRSRNDQVATDLRLWCKGQAVEVAGSLLRLVETVSGRAEEALAADAYLPGYTHLQQAQPVSLGHHLAAWAWMLLRDVERLAAAHRAADVSPLGAGALAGSTLPLDVEATAAQLGFSRVFDNSLDAVGDRDFVADLLYALAMAANHLSRIGEELVLWTSTEFGFATIGDGHATGSSMMPQKKNPDVAELARAKAARLLGNLTGWLATTKGLPLAYNKDLQEDKEPLFDGCDAVLAVAAALDGLVGSLEFHPRAMAAAADNPFGAATDLAEYLVAQGTAFREAHHTVAGLVRQALEEAAVDAADEQPASGGGGGDASTALRPGQAEARFVALVTAHPQLGPEAAELTSPGGAYRRRNTRGGGGPAAVADQLVRLRAATGRARAQLGTTAASAVDSDNPPDLSEPAERAQA